MLQYSQNKGTEQAFQSTGSGAAGAVQGLRETTGNSIKYMEDEEMKVMIEGYEVEIKAKYTSDGKIEGGKMNKDDTMAVLNLLSIWAYEAAAKYDLTGCYALSKGARKTASDIYDLLESKNYFN